MIKGTFLYPLILTWIHISVIPLGLLLFFLYCRGYGGGGLFMPVWFFIGHIKLRGPFGLMLHNITHRRLLKEI
jgi:hypothetical protein